MSRVHAVVSIIVYPNDRPVGNSARGVNKILLTIYGIVERREVAGEIWSKVPFKIDLES